MIEFSIFSHDFAKSEKPERYRILAIGIRPIGLRIRRGSLSATLRRPKFANRCSFALTPPIEGRHTPPPFEQDHVPPMIVEQSMAAAEAMLAIPSSSAPSPKARSHREGI